MAISEATVAVNMVAGEDLRGDVYEILQVENDGGIGKVIKATAVTDTVVGILGEDPDGTATTDGEMVPVVMLQGIVKVKAGATITAGQLIVPDVTAGRVAGIANVGTLAVDSMAIGVALESAVDGDIFEMFAQTIAAPHSA
jgi:hypothetical protein